MSAACPVCRKNDLSPVKLSYDLPALGCMSCGGVLLSLILYSDWRDRHPNERPASSRGEGAEAAEIDDTKNALLCPKCRGFMTKYRMRADASNVLDLCAHCDEVWFDRGEWSQVEDLALSGQLSRVFSERWQKDLRKAEFAQRAEQRYREQLGEDYEELAALRERLIGHPKAKEILAYLYTSQTVRK